MSDQTPDNPPAYRPSWERDPVASTSVVLLGAFSAALTGIGLFLVLVMGWESYGPALFVGTPLAMGMVASVVINHRREHRLRSTVQAVIASHLIIAVVLLALAMEGLICLAMAFPLSLAISLPGIALGLVVTRSLRDRRKRAALLVLILPLMLSTDRLETEWPLRQVVTEVEIDAPPEVVWRHVVRFTELPPPSELVFRLGIAYPLRARLVGEGVDAVRYCEFSTGPFVEPITVWDPPRRLAFDVSSQPEPMHEWSPYRRVHAPHLLNGLQSRRGEFRITALPGGRSRLRGTTWYELQMGPQLYWGVWSDSIIHSIHRRVLRQIRTEAEEAEGDRAITRL